MYLSQVRNKNIILNALLLVFIFTILSCQGKKKKRLLIKPNILAKEAVADTVTPELTFSEKSFMVDSFFTEISEKNDFNGTVLVSHNDKVIYRKAFGYANFGTKELLQENSVFQLASISKQFTAVAVLMLYEKGLINFDDDITKYFPDFPYSGITIRMLLSHRSGLPNYMYFCDEYYTNKSVALTNHDVIDLMIKYKPPLYFQRDRKFNYCNTNYCLLASIIQEVTKIPFDVFITRKIFIPLGMNRSFIGNSIDFEYKDLLTTGYDENNKPINPDYLDGILGDKGIFSCINDLNKWDKALYTNKLIKQSTLALALSPANKDMIGNRNYGYGWRIKFLDDTPLYYHGGWWKGYNTYYLRNPKDHSSIIILSNKVNWSFNSITSFLNRFYNYKGSVEYETI